ncbi:MAG: hypothetical protein V1709_07310 [Planctomycetota bacterium]
MKNRWVKLAMAVLLLGIMVTGYGGLSDKKPKDTGSIAPITGKLTRHVWYTGAGTDGKWFTADDVVNNYESYTYDVQGNKTRWVPYTGVGTDGKWFTADDVVNNYESYTYDAQGNKTRWVLYTGAGTDKKWFTTDDVVDKYKSFIYDDQGRRTRDVYYRDAGTDGIWFTADDVVGDYDSFIYNAQWEITEVVYYHGAGTDGIWFNADDVVWGGSLFSDNYDQNNRRWRHPTRRDEMSAYDSYIHDDQRKQTRTIYHKIGPGGVTNITDDDDDSGVSSYSSFIYDAQDDVKGKLTREVWYNGAGTDRKWFTADDVVGGYDSYIYN